MPVHRRVTPSIKFASTHLYTWVERGTVRVKCLAQEHNTMSPARARTRTARSGDEGTNHEATAPPIRIEVAGGSYKITGESGHSEKNLTSSFYTLMKFSRKIPCSSRRILRSPMLNEHPDSVQTEITAGKKIVQGDPCEENKIE